MKDNDTIKDRFEDTAQDLLDYGKLQLDRLKLQLLEKMATLFNSIFSVFILILLGAFALVFLTIALTMVLAHLVGSMLIAVLIMAAVFILLLIIVYAKRKTLFINNMVKMWSKTLFDNDKD